MEEHLSKIKFGVVYGELWQPHTVRQVWNKG